MTGINLCLHKMSVMVLIAIIIVASVLSPAFAYEACEGSVFRGYFQGEELMMLSNQTDSQMMSFVITSGNGTVIVIDGGTEGDAAHLRDILAQKGNHVKAWFISHPHSDHAGALARIIEEGPGELTIDAIVCNFADQTWYEQSEPYRAGFVERIRSDISRYSNRNLVMHKGDTFYLDGMNITCMNDPYLVSGNAINNSSCVLKVEMGGKKIVFLGDMGKEAGDMFLADHAGEDLKCDILQMAHHGQSGVDRNVYEALSPQTCLWCAPEWLYNDCNGRYRSAEVKSWMKSLGVKDNFSLKNGNVILR